MFEYQYAILGTLIVYPHLFDVCILTKEYFENQFHQIFEECQKLYIEDDTILLEKLYAIKGINLDLIEQCTNHGIYRDANSFIKLQNMAIDKHKKKQIMELSNQLCENVVSLADYDTSYRQIVDHKIENPTYLSSKELLDSCTNSLKNIKFTYFKNLGYKLKLFETDFMVLAGGTGIGKTGLALNLLNDLSMTYPCLYLNMEMSPQALQQRLISINSNVFISKLPNYETLESNEINDINEAINNLAQRNIEIISVSQSIEQIRNVIATHHHEKHMIVFIDHIGLVKYSKAKSAYERVTEVAKELRRICIDYNCTIIGLSQLSRIHPEDKQPRLSMLRDSGELEQSARKVIFMWQNNFNGIENYQIVIEKNDSNAKGIVDIDYHKNTQIIREKY